MTGGNRWRKETLTGSWTWTDLGNNDDDDDDDNYEDEDEAMVEDHGQGQTLASPNIFLTNIPTLVGFWMGGQSFQLQAVLFKPRLNLC